MLHYSNFKTVKKDLEIPGLGELTGLEFDNGSEQYLGIPYATFPRRFAPSKVLTEWTELEKGVKRDATKYGPEGAQPYTPMFFPFQPRPWLPDDGLVVQRTDRKEMLTLNVTVPKTSKDHSKLLPVMVWIHGGANTIGGSATCEFDGISLATLSAEISKPTIIITLNYRLGYYGFLYSNDIRNFNLKEGFGDSANFGFWDQVNALRWVQQYVHAFGGDPENVTIFGQSAGSAAVNMHLWRGEKLFKRAILQSGSISVCGIDDLESADKFYFRLLDQLGIDHNLPGDARVEQLLRIESSVMVEAQEALFKDQEFSIVPYVIDEHLFPSSGNPRIPADSGYQIPEFVDSLMIGDTYEEFGPRPEYLEKTPGPVLFAHLKQKASPELFEILTEHYDLYPDMTRDDLSTVGTALVTDSTFALPNFSLALLISSELPIYCFHFDQKSDFEPTKGMAHHSLDFIYIWNMFNEVFQDPRSADLSRKMGTRFLEFANGLEPWSRYEGIDPKYQIFGPDGADKVLALSEDLPRKKRYEAWKKICAKGLQREFYRVCWELGYGK
ncbi:unnamed protein product [Kuraishia capsulata CBS 1993]|uniref:Carboxylic ester hydrolase n=1 Tax=Kuraishia capsulata CBS 1993 TaxID=1382522 RepID=W6MPV7_9ASCO|nr:uncharacterized protein KUCA_T00003200001 [Kuraishia capsulata CBS 1993]CDK27222.1 unnamed protein product [Kuraishia capsulata CBS 1993]